MDKSGDMDRQLWKAVLRSDIERVEQLLEKGASVNARNEDFFNWSVLMEACDNKNKAMVYLLLKRGAAINESSDAKMTALMISAVKGDEEIFELLVEHHADVTKKDIWGPAVDIDDNCGQTPLWLAAENGYTDCVDVLLVHGANPDHKSKKAGSPLDIAKEKDHTEIVSMMTESLELRSHRYVACMISGIFEIKENIETHQKKRNRQERQVYQLKVEKERLQGELKKSQQETTRLTSEVKLKDGQLKQLLSSFGSFRRVVEGIEQQPGGSISDLEKLFEAVGSRGCDRWYSLCLHMGYSSGEVEDITSGIPNHADKIRAVLNKKIDAVGERDALEVLLEACRRIRYPIIGSVMDVLSQ